MALWRRLPQSVVAGSSPASPRSRRLAAFAPLVAVALVVWMVVAVGLPRSAPPAVAAPQIILSSHPYPLIVGTDTLFIQLVDASGGPLQAARVTVDTSSVHPGTLPLSRPASLQADGTYSATLTWSMTGQWSIDVAAELTTGELLREHFDVYVYPVPPENENPRTTFISAGELAAVAYDPAREVRIVIPQGTNAGIIGGHGDDVIGEEIRLSVSGRNTLTIQNNDLVDHNVGPFTVRAGETVRQEFRRPAEYVGACSIRHGAEVSIIVDA